MKKNSNHYTKLFLFLSFISIFVILSCSTNNSQKEKIVIGIVADLETVNPLYSFSVNEANIDELLFLSLVKHKWNEEKGDIVSEPMLAKSWEWNNDSTEITLNLRPNVTWSDGNKFTTEDVVFSFDLYSDPVVQSFMYGAFDKFYTDNENHIIIEKSFEIISPLKLKIKFKPGSNPSLFNIDFPILPKHIFEKIDRKEIANATINFNPVTNGPFKLKKWERNQYLILEKNANSFLVTDKTINELIFKIIPEYNSRINQLKNGEIDLMEFIKTDDLEDLNKIETLKTGNMKGREYDYIGWNNIDIENYSNGKKIKPNILFGDRKVRTALTHAINREEILKSYLKNNGSISSGPVSPIFKHLLNQNVVPYNYDPNKATELLNEAGWKDNNHDGILEKGNKKFEFTLTIPSGNPRRSFAATVIKQNLKDVGINVSIESIEIGTFINKLQTRSMNAWMAGWGIPLPLDLDISWNSNLDATQFNFMAYQNREVDGILEQLKTSKDQNKKNELFKKIQEIIHYDQPATFLYWVDNIVAYNKKISGVNINPLGVVHHCWEWSINK